MTKPRLRTSKTCKGKYESVRLGQVCCSPRCAIAYSKTQREKREAGARVEERKRDRAKLAAMKPRSHWVKKAQTAFNAYIRHRDKDKPCICCGLPLDMDGSTHGGAYDCGHYRSTGSAPHLRFDERNAHAQRKVCNRYGAGRAVDYRIGLIKRIGAAAVDEIEADNTPRKYSVDDLKQIAAQYRAMTKQLQQGRGE